MTFFILGKNVEKNLEIMLSEIVDLGSMFKEYNVLFIDGNSSDATKQIFDEVILVSSAKEVVFKSAPSDNLLETQGSFDLYFSKIDISTINISSVQVNLSIVFFQGKEE